jgi:protein-tyrosine phosphatase
MIPLADLHCHLLAGLDDGPRSADDALAMCRMAYDDGTRLMAATAHQNDRYPDVTPERIRDATERLADLLRQAGIEIKVFACAEVMVHPEIEFSWRSDRLLSMGDRRQYLLVEMPHGLFVDLRAIVRQLRDCGVRPVLAHPERSPELLHEPGAIEELVQAGTLVQVSTHSITEPASSRDERAIRDWFKRGIVHVLGSDGHSPRRRPPKMAAAYKQIVRWAGAAVADRVGSTSGMAILQGLPLKVPRIEPRRKRWFSGLWSMEDNDAHLRCRSTDH